jgi:2-keto-4-pentenoate hydratase/2-oxohepta-3-ene-1,7-dioic acid hydratase in catechol pathway
VICAGKNFAGHTKEMGDKTPPKEPVIFLKPNSSVLQSPSVVHVPEKLGLLHHEVELCLLISKDLKEIDEDDVAEHIAGFCVGLDLTLRGKQNTLKDKSHPWELSKAFDNSCILGAFLQLKEISSLNISLKVNEYLRQNSNTKLMIFSPERLISFASQFFTLKKGDIVMCGTPEGVGPLSDGDLVEAYIENLPPLTLKISR